MLYFIIISKKKKRKEINHKLLCLDKSISSLVIWLALSDLLTTGAHARKFFIPAVTQCHKEPKTLCFSYPACPDFW